MSAFCSVNSSHRRFKNVPKPDSQYDGQTEDSRLAQAYDAIRHAVSPPEETAPMSRLQPTSMTLGGAFRRHRSGLNM